MAEPTAQPDPPQPCGACGGSGSVISNISGSPHAVSCPWCDGGGTFLAAHDAQEHWKQEQEQEPSA